MKFPIRPLAVAAAAAAAGAALAHGVSGRTEPVEEAADAARDAVTADRALFRAASKVVALLAKRSNEKSLANEIGSVAGAARIAETTLADQAALLAALSDAADGYATDLSAARAVLALAAESASLPAKTRKRYAAALTKFDRAFPAERRAARVPTPTADRLAAYARAAAAAKGFTPYDAGTTLDWVLATVGLAPANQGVDLTGDGKPDNILATLQQYAGSSGNVGDLLGAGVSQDGRYAILEFSHVQDLAKGDPFVVAGVIGGTDADGDAGNDLSGTGSFAPVDGAVGMDGLPVVRTAASVAKGGRYRLVLTGQSVPLGGITLPPEAKIVIEGTAASASNDGYVGVAIPTDVLLAAIDQAGIDLGFFALLLPGLADVDTDGNGTKDAFSASFAFTSVPATVVR